MKKIITVLLFIASHKMAMAQNVGIGTATPVARLHVADSSVLFSAIGVVNPTPGNPPIEGAGRRMMWYADKAAFRAGYVNSNEWDKVNIGYYSLATGLNTTASGTSSTAMGNSTTASGGYSTTMGQNTTAIGTGSTAIGFNTIASGFASTAMGGTTTASGLYSTAMGKHTNATGYASTAIGDSSLASGAYSLASGLITRATGPFSIAMGENTTASGTNSVAIGEGTLASGLGSIALGSGTDQAGTGTTASGARSVAMGSQTTASGSFSTAMGTSTNAIGSFSTAMGYSTNAIGDNSTAIGSNTTASGDRSTAMGVGTTASGSHSTAMGVITVASGDRSTAMGNYVSTNNQGGSFIIGDNSTTTVLNSANANNFRARFDGGYRLFTSANLSTGCTLFAGDNAWTTGSDVNSKENFAEVNGEDFLEKISGFHLSSWNYKTQNPKTFRHYGPMAQDFYAAFGKDKYGTIGNDTTINSADFAGVSFVAIQALEKRTTEYKKEVDELKTENAALRTMLLQLKKEVDALQGIKKDAPGNSN